MITLKEMHALERHAKSQGVFSSELMDNAGKQVARVIKERYPLAGKHIIIFAGSGHNGGDGLVAARHLATECPTSVFLFTSKQELSETVKEKYDLIKGKVPIFEIKTLQDLQNIKIQPGLKTIIIDALIGTGFTPPLQEPLLSAINYFNGLKSTKISIDIPSGTHPDQGPLNSAYCQSDVIIALHDIKIGLQEFADKTIIVDIGIPN